MKCGRHNALSNTPCTNGSSHSAPSLHCCDACFYRLDCHRCSGSNDLRSSCFARQSDAMHSIQNSSEPLPYDTFTMAPFLERNRCEGLHTLNPRSPPLSWPTLANRHHGRQSLSVRGLTKEHLLTLIRRVQYPALSHSWG